MTGFGFAVSAAGLRAFRVNRVLGRGASFFRAGVLTAAFFLVAFGVTFLDAFFTGVEGLVFFLARAVFLRAVVVALRATVFFLGFGFAEWEGLVFLAAFTRLTAFFFAFLVFAMVMSVLSNSELKLLVLIREYTERKPIVILTGFDTSFFQASWLPGFCLFRTSVHLWPVSRVNPMPETLRSAVLPLYCLASLSRSPWKIQPDRQVFNEKMLSKGGGVVKSG
jgi:hypothetical protein